MTPADETSTKVDRIILEAARGKRLLALDDLWAIQEHVANAWYNLSREQRIPGVLAGTLWNGRVIQSGDMLPTDVVHYLKHVVVRQEWPLGMTFDGYRESLREVICDPASGLMTSV